MSHDNHFNSEVNKSPKRYHRRGEKGGLTMRWVAFENKSKCFYVLGMSQVWVFVLLFVSKVSSVECFMHMSTDL